jgi:hypothetical protein
MIILKYREKGLELRTILKSTFTHKFRRLDMSTPKEILKVELEELEDYETSDCTSSQIDTRYHAKLDVLECLTEEELEILANERETEECLREYLRDEIAESSSEDDLGR